jgi:sulfoxide reductase heme-binding subunit YedZ
MRPWLDRSGRMSPLRSTVFALLFAPGLWLVWRLAGGQLGARPITEVIHHTGLWAIRLLLISLAITPLRQLLFWPQLISVRRMVGVAAFAYAAAHLGAYAADQKFQLVVVVMEIVRRFYLTIGATALLALLLLAATSTDGMIRRLGGRAWRRLHGLVYPVGIVAAVHFFLQSKLDVVEPFVMAGLLFWLLGYRLLPEGKGQPLRQVGMVAALSLLAGLLTFAGEITYYRLAFHADPLRVLAASFSLQAGLRPGWTVLAIGLGITAIAAARTRLALAKLLVAPAS